MSLIGAALSVFARSAQVLSLSNLINLSIILNRSRDTAARTRGKPSTFHISSRFSLFCLCTPAAIRIPINTYSSASIDDWNVSDNSPEECRNLLSKSFLKASQTLLLFQFVSLSIMSQISCLVINLNNCYGVNRLLVAAGLPF